MDDPSTGVWSLTHVWLGATTIAGTIVAFFTKRLVDTVDGKADQKEVDELKTDFKTWLARQDQRDRDAAQREEARHQANTQRLDSIFTAIADRRKDNQHRSS
jgi:hypothetical protein